MILLTHIFNILPYILPFVLTQEAEVGVDTTTDVVTEEALVTGTNKFISPSPETETTAVTNATTKRTTTTRRPSATEYDLNVWCKMQANQFVCDKFGKARHMFYYDIRLEDCKSFTYGGCPEAVNMFRTITECHDTCRDVRKSYYRDLPPAIYCLLQPDFGNCNDYNPMYYFDVSSGQCKGFSYSGCGGNQNKFKDVQQCTTECAIIIESLLQ